MISGTNTDTPVCNGGYHAPLREEATTRVLLLPAACLATDFRRQRSTVHPPLIIFASERALIHPPAHLAIRKGPHHCCCGYAATIEPVARVCIQASFFPSLFRLFLLREWLAPGASLSFPLSGNGMGGGAQSSMGRPASTFSCAGCDPGRRRQRRFLSQLILLVAVCGCESVCLHACPVAWFARRNTDYGYPSLFDFPFTLPQAVACAFSQSQ
jgi:hypothetical protein